MKPPRLSVVEGGDPSRRQAAGWFARLRADDVSESDRRAWQQWMAEDARHRAAYERIERLWSAAGEHAQHPRIAERLRDAVAMPAPRRRGYAGYAWGAAALAAALALAAIAPMLLRRPVADTQYLTRIGESRTVALADGSRVSMDTDSRISVDFSGAQRRITLDRGRAYFRVARSSRPFLVDTDSGSVRAVGTEYEVYRRDDTIEVALVEGRVALLAARSGDAGQAALGMLDPGQRARFGKHQPLQRLDAGTPAAPPTWLSGKLLFEDQSLAAAVAEFNRYSLRPIRLSDERMARLRVSGVFRSDDPQSFVEALETLYPVVASESAKGEIVIAERR